ncbi:MAG: hypothetical protein ACRDFA_07430 [bacterium]
MKKASWHIPSRPDRSREDQGPVQLLQEILPKSEAYLLAYEDFRRWKEAAETARVRALEESFSGRIDLDAIKNADERLKALDDEVRHKFSSLERMQDAATKELGRVMGFDYAKVQAALPLTSLAQDSASGCGAVVEEWTAAANKSWKLDSPPLSLVSPNVDFTRFDVTLTRVGAVIQNHYYIPIFPEGGQGQWSCISVEGNIYVSGLADVPSGGDVYIRGIHFLVQYRNQPWNPGPAGTWFRPPDEGSPTYRRYCAWREFTDSASGLHSIPAFALGGSFVSHDVRAGDFFEYVIYVNVVAHGSLADLTGIGGVIIGKPVLKIFGQ